MDLTALPVFSARRTRLWLATLFVIGCSTSSSPAHLSDADQRAIADSISRQVKAAYDITKPDVEQRMLSLYPTTGRIVSAAGGHVVSNRDSIAQGIKYFWENVGMNMRNPHWIWDQMLIDVLSPDAAVMTATYHVPHFTPAGMPHTIGGAWTAVFQKRDGRWYIIQEHLSDLPAPPADSMSMKMPATKKP